jgi:MFS transporter, DHA2 family, multidrug resistance protein
VLMPRSLVMLVFMPIVGAAYNYLGPKIMIASGLLIAGMAPIMMSHFTLASGGMELFWPQIVQGVGFVLIFVALSTAALAGIDKPRMTSATGLYNLIRQLGGSFGTAVFATMLSSMQQSNHAVLAQHINPYHPAFSQRFQMLQQGFIARGIDAWDARMKALAVIEGMISQQASMLSFERSFYLIGALFFLCLPLVFMLKAAPRGKHAEPVEV